MADAHVHRWRSRLPLVLVILSLVLLIVVPILVRDRIGDLRREISDIIVPARTTLTEVQLALALETAGTRGYLLTGEARYAAEHLEARARRRRIFGRLMPMAQRLGPEAAVLVSELSDLLRPADALLDALYDGRMAPEQYRAYLSGQHERFRRIATTTVRLHEIIAREEAAHRAAIQRTERLGAVLTVLLVILALIAALLVARLGQGYRRLAARLDMRARRQAALREVAGELAASLDVGRTVQIIAERAVASTHAIGAYVEHTDVLEPGAEVEVVAVAGTLAPPLGTRIPYPGSLTEEVIESGEPEIVTEVGAIGEHVGPYLEECCRGCSGLIVPLAAEDLVMGALVLLRESDQDPFTPEDEADARILGSLASAALRRVLILESLRESEERFRQIADHIGEVIWLGAPDLSERYYVSPAYERIWGRSRESFIRYPWSPLEAVHPEDRPRVRKALRTVSEGTYDTEYRIIRPDGKIRWIRSRAYPIRNERGEVYRIAGIMEDVTARKIAADERERSLALERAARERVTTILESITDAFYALDRDWRFTYVNHQAERVLQRSRDELLGRNVWREFPETVDQTTEHEYRRAVAEQTTVEFEQYYTPLDIWVNVRAYPSADGLSVFLRDVTGRKRAEQELAIRLRQFHALATLGQRALVDTDLNSLFQAVADVAADQLDADFVELLELLPEERHLLLRAGTGWNPGLVGHATISSGRASMAGYTLLATEPVIVRNLGTEDRFRGSPLLLEHGVTSGITVVIQGRKRPWGALGAYTREERAFSGDDIYFLQSVSNILAQAIELRRTETERERLLEEEQKARSESEQRREELQRVTESRDRLVRGFTHDVKNPLGAADGQLQLLEAGIHGQLADPQQDSVARARRSIGAALDLIQDLLALARAEAGRMIVQPEPTSLCDVAREAAGDYRAQAEAKGLRLRLELPDEIPTIESDADRIRQVVGNLLSNAVKYTEQGTVTVRVEVREDGRGPAPGRWIAIDVADTGPGLTKEQQRKLFQEFRRLETAGGTAGAGIGLVISRRIARALGGDVTVVSEAGRGSTFTLWLPLRVEDERARTEERKAAD